MQLSEGTKKDLTYVIIGVFIIFILNIIIFNTSASIGVKAILILVAVVCAIVVIYNIPSLYTNLFRDLRPTS
jgi:hypothetical protein